MDNATLGNLAQQFWNDKQGQSLSYDHVAENIGQCVQPVEIFWQSYLHVSFGVFKYAYLYAKSFGGLTFVTNNPNDPNQIPPKGAAIVWASNLPGSLDSGHIAIFWGNNPAAHTFVSIDSNWGGKTLHQVTHNWQYVLGWLVPTPQAVYTVQPQPNVINILPEENEMITTDAQAHQVYKALRPNGDGDAGEIAATVNKRTFAQFFNDAQPEVTQRDAAIAQSNATLASAQGTIDSLNSTITSLNTQGVEDDKKLADALAQISKDTADLTTAHDQIVDLQKLIANPSLANAQAVAQNATPTTTQSVAKANLGNSFFQLLGKLFPGLIKKS
jgi:hypothetical protein